MTKTQIIIFNLALALGSASMAETSADNETSAESPESATSPTSSRTAFIDPETGQLTSEPTQEMMADLDQQARSMTAPVDTPEAEPQVQYMEDGSMMIKLDDRFKKPLNASISDDGELETGHHISADD